MFIRLLEERRSIRNYLKNPVEPEKIDILIEAALRSPSSRSLNPWEFIVVTEKDILEKLSTSKKHGAGFLKDAPLGIVVLADPRKCDVWIEDASIASVFIHLAATSLGLGSCWIQIRERMVDAGRSSEDYVREVLAIPEKIRVLSIIAVGYPDEEADGHPKNSLLFNRIHRNRFGAS